MKQEKQQEIYESLHEKIMKTTKSKTFDYANDDDILSNFKEVSIAAKALNINVHTSTGNALFMVVLKIARITNLLNSNKTPNNEAIDDSFLDGINYFKLAYCNYIDEKEG